MSTEFFNDQWRIPSNENQNKVSNYSMNFDGSSTKVDLGSTIGNIGVSSTTISFWLNIPTTTSHQTVLSNRGSGGGWAIDMFDNAGQYTISFFNASSSTSIRCGFSDFNTWAHIVFVRDGIANNKIYINGVSQTLTSNNENLTNIISSKTLTIGAQDPLSNGYYRFLNGKIDQVTIFDYALSQDQVTQLGAEGYAFNFIPNDYIDLGTTTAYDTGDLSAAIWVNASSSRTGTVYAFSNSGSPSFAGFDFVIYASNQIRIRRSTMTKSNQTSSLTIGFSSDTWQHLAFTYNESTNTIKVFLNAVLQDTSIGFTQTNTASKKLTIGSYKGTSAFFNGELSNAQVFNTKLEDSEIATLYNNGKPLADMSSFTSLQGWWKLDETATFNSGTSVWSIPDDSSNSNTGTSVGMNSSNLVASNINGELIANPMITSPKPIAYYQLGDQSVNNGANYLVPNNSLSDYVFNFVNPSDGVNVGSSNVFNFGTGDFTISMWFKINSAFAYLPYLFDFRPTSSPSTSAPGVYISSSNRAYLFGGGTIIPGSAGKILAAGVWYNFVVKRTGNTFTTHYDGGSADRTGTSTVDFNTDLEVHIGSRFDNVNGFDGEISNFQVFNSALPQTGSNSIETIYNNGSPLTSMSGFTSLVAWYKLNASEIFNSTSTEWSVDNNAYPSVYKSSLNFDGSSDYIDTPQIDLGSTNTISFWINTTTTTQGTIFGDPNGYADYALFSQPSLNRTAFRLGNNDSGYYQIEVSSGLLNDGNWHHHCLTRDGVTVNYYIDGILQTNVINNTLNASAGTNTTIENIFAMPDASFKYSGKLSNVALFNSALISSKVQTLYNNGTPEASISHSPVSWWKLDNTTTGLLDSGSASNNGTNVGGATEYAGFVNALAGESSGMDSSNLVVSDLQQTSGYSPYALSLDGVDDYLDCGDSDTFSFGNGTTDSPFSISAWINMTDATKFRIANKLGNSSNIEYIFTTSAADIIALNLYDESSGGRIGRKYNTPLTSYEGQWIHVLCTYDGTASSSGIKIYLNSSRVDDDTSDVSPYTAMENTTQPFLIGQQVGTYANGTFSNVSVFNIELSSTQVTEVYNQGVPSNLNTFSGTAPVAWWQLGSNSSFNTNWTCLDEIGTNNAVSAGGMTNNDIVDGPGYSAMGLGTSSIDIKGDAPYSTANGLSENMDVLDRTTDVPS
ncbi:LamG domain-containing protein [bacterium]|nr:LamG domain-containing protein [bacterium]